MSLNPARRDEQIINWLFSACETMEEGCADSRRLIIYARDNVNSDLTLDNVIQQVLHNISWGFANSTSDVGHAMAARADQVAEELYLAHHPETTE